MTKWTVFTSSALAACLFAFTASAECPDDTVEGGFTVNPTVVADSTNIGCPASTTVTRSRNIAFQCEWGRCGSQAKDFQSEHTANGECAFLESPPPPVIIVCRPSAFLFKLTDFEYEDRATNKHLNEHRVCKAGSINKLTLKCPDCLACPENDANSPILISISDSVYQLTSFLGGVEFDLDSDGFAERISWTAADADDGFLVLDRNENGTIDNGTEVFGDVTPQPPSKERNGFRALAMFDDPVSGGNGDGQISAEDAIFTHLQIWLDASHDGFSQASELFSLTESGIESIGLDYTVSSRRDLHGNEFRYKGHAVLGENRRTIWDVFFVTQ